MATEAKRLFPTFYVHPQYGPVCETKTGPEAGADTVIQKVNEEHAMLHPAEYARFVSGGGLVKPSGTSLKQIPGVDDTLVSVLAVHGVTSVEKFASLGDAEAAALMPQNSLRAIELRDVARLVAGKKAPEPAPAPALPSVLDDPEVVEMRKEMTRLRAAKEAAEADRDAALELASGSQNEPQDEPGEEASAETVNRSRGGRPRKAG